ncbi:ROK family protein [Bifidobacterium tsurumiense]|uniref:ROK family protein n=2 Tax=Bifidobacterium tsurumiense TaxID=356829 RepID=A0A087EKB0_9BIFI|nr:ROK family protein [Bifidobacterium tsurumiense]
MAETLIGIDVGGTKIEGTLVDRFGHVLDTYKVPARSGNACVVEDVVTVARHLSDEALPVGIGIPGRVDTAHGMVWDVVNLGILELPLAEEVSSQLGSDVRVVNDVNAAALGASAALASGDVGNDALEVMAFLNLGTGLAAGVTRYGKLDHGFSGALGEIGHIPVDPNQLPCPCGQRGCLETVGSGKGLRELWPQANPAMPDIIARCEQGDEHAQEVLAKVMHAIGDALQIITQTYDPHIIVIGGGISKTGEPLLQAISKEMTRRASSSHFIETIDIPSRLRLAPSGVPIGAIGAAMSLLS